PRWCERPCIGESSDEGPGGAYAQGRKKQRNRAALRVEEQGADRGQQAERRLRPPARSDPDGRCRRGKREAASGKHCCLDRLGLTHTRLLLPPGLNRTSWKSMPRAPRAGL